MSDEYTPTREEVRERHGSAWSAPYRDELLRNFDRMMTDELVRAETRGAERALREAADDIEGFVDDMGDPSPGWRTGVLSTAQRLRARADRIVRGESGGV